jgi:IS5 family transposase
MNDRMSAPVSSTGGATGASAGSTVPRSPLATLTEHNRTRALNLARGTHRAQVRSKVLRAGAVFLTAAAGVAAGVALAPQAGARVLPVPVVTAKPGPVTVPSGAVRCTGKGDFHATLSVRTTRTDRKRDHHAAVYLQESQGGRARMVGYAWSQGAVTRVTVCVNPAKIEGGRGPVYLIVEDAIDGYTRPVEVRFPRGVR